MLSEDVRNAFVEKKKRHTDDNDEEILLLKDYILSTECTDDIKRLIRGDYYFDVPRRFYIRRADTKRKRVCYKFSPKNNYILKLMAYVLMDYDSLFSDSLYSFRKYQDHRTFFGRIKEVDPDRKLYVLKTDIHSYGESLDQDILLSLLEPIVGRDRDFYNFLKWFITRNEYTDQGKVVKERFSIQPGAPIGSFFNNVYLMDMDRYIEAHSRFYMRFADDIAVYCDSLSECERIRDYISDFIKQRKLCINLDKTRIYSPGEEYAILGIAVGTGEYDISRDSLDKIMFKMERRANNLLRRIWKKKISKEEAQRIYIAYLNNYFYGKREEKGEINWTTWSFGIINSTKGLMELDHHVQNLIRMVSTGKKSGKRYNTNYEDIKEAGYKSLVHAYYHGVDKISK